MFRNSVIATIMGLGLAACDAPQTGTLYFDPGPSGGGLQPIGGAQATSATVSVAPPNAPSGPVADNFARSFLNSIQTQSIQERREYCGYFFVDAAGQINATPPRRGTFASCDMPAPRPGQGIFASYHTHGAFDLGYDNEVPSSIDLISDFQFGIDGYVSTPGGRIWLVDYQTRSTSQVCGRGCVISDPSFPRVENPPVRAAYTLPEIRRRQGG